MLASVVWFWGIVGILVLFRLSSMRARPSLILQGGRSSCLAHVAADVADGWSSGVVCTLLHSSIVATVPA